MTESISHLKDRILRHIDDSVTDLDRVNVNELGEFVDMVKDLGEAYYYCHKGRYYMAITDAMDTHESHSHIKDDLDDNDVISKLGDEYRSLTPEERRVMKNKVLSTLGIK